MGWFFRGCALFLMATLLSENLFAQYDSTTVVADTIPVIENTSPAETIEPEEESYDYYFSEKWDYLRDTGLQQRNVPASATQKMKTDDAFWYADSSGVVQEKSKAAVQVESTSDSQSGSFQTVLWIILFVVFAAGLLWYLMSNRVGLFSKKDVAIAGNKQDSLSVEDIYAINYQKELTRAEAAGNYRLAIRLMFLKLLKNMSEKKVIRYQQDKTNFDYLSQLQQTKYYNGFFRVTRFYEYSWYGNFEVQPSVYERVKNDFNQFENQI